ncbi:sensor histidine kinase [Ammoniphilus sp. CFH 90114]|uniref:sensor histidine kinase n=1 Tax=Ammoniphilus sp. CFH 90114 TaxID=2493665 RepID=UPI0013E980D2|nr:histidine kinase [Ammoniphilus sp. CFH 90114]
MFSIRYKLTLLLLASIIIPIVASISITYSHTKSSVTEKTIQENSKLLFQGKINLSNYLQSIDRISHSVLFSGTAPYLLDVMQRRHLTDKDFSKIKLSITQLGDFRKEFHQVFLYSDRQKQGYLYHDVVTYQRMMEYQPLRNVVYIQPTHWSDQYGINQSNLIYKEDPKLVFSFYRTIEDIPLPDRLGVLSIDVGLDYVRYISDMLYTKGEEQFFLLDQQGSVIYSSEQALIGSNLLADWMKPLFAKEETSSHFTVEDKGSPEFILYDTVDLPYAQWKLVKKIPYSWLYQDAAYLTQMNMYILMGSLILAIGASLLVIHSFIKPIRQLIYEMDIVERGKLDVQFPNLKRNDEFGVLSRRFHQMVDRIHSLILKEYRLELINKTHLLKALQAQINPHFFNNALQSIGTLALKDKNMKIYSLTSSLGKMMHYNMNIDESIVPLKIEMDYIKSYLALQKQRFEEELQIEMEIDPATLDILIPKMILQPIVENYFEHGRFAENTKGRLSVATRLEDGELLVLIVEDNGQGMEEAKRKKISSLLHHEADLQYKSTEHIGLVNVMTRLRVYFHTKVTVNLTPLSPHGLKVEISIPLKREGAVDDESVDRG